MDDLENVVPEEPVEPTEELQAEETPEPEEHEDAEPEGDEEEPKLTRYQKLANERREAKEVADRERMAREAAERERDYYRQLGMTQQPIQDLDPDEKWRQEVQSRVNQALFQAQDTADRAAYMAKSADPIYRKYQDRVEQTLAQARNQGNWGATREGILALLVGQDALKNSGKKTSTQKEAERRVTKARGEPEGIKPGVSKPSNSGDMSIADFEAQFGNIRI